MNEFGKHIKRNNLYKEYTKILNGLLQLSDREAELFALLLKVDFEWEPKLGEPKNILSTDTRRAIMKETRINKNNLSKYIGVLKEKGVLIKTEDGYEIREMFVPKLTGDLLEVVFVLDTLGQTKNFT
jgi:hypothetical protein